ncbi:MAG: hypothetical protein VYC34_11740 [Planctomycetota bacterium]|nr:hypothetical protein [Planctomycetota bacterium]
MGLVIPAIGRASRRDREQAQLASLLDLLAAERIEAVKAMTPRRVELETDGASLRALRESDGSVKTWPDWLLAPAPTPEGPDPWRIVDADRRAASVVFEGSGRSRVHRLSWAASNGSDRIWTVVFDPVSGEASLELGGPP